MKRKVAGSIAVLLMMGVLLSACSQRTYTFDGKKTKHCGCVTHRGIIG